jgi:hypothetical protein
MKRVTKHSENKSSVFAAIHKSVTLNRKGGCIMKKPIVYGSSLMSLLVILFAGIFMAAGCEKPIETNPNNSKSSTLPDTIDCSDYRFAPCYCNWGNIAYDSVYLINSQETLLSFVSCEGDNTPATIDFDKYSLLLVHVGTTQGVQNLTKNLIHTSENEYVLDVDITLNMTMYPEGWRGIILVPRLSQHITVSLNKNMHF